MVKGVLQPFQLVNGQIGDNEVEAHADESDNNEKQAQPTARVSWGKARSKTRGIALPISR
jgi:hypothetical protein